MAEFDVGFGSAYLTPYQELMETRNLGQRALEESIRTNPLVQRDAAVLAGAAPPTTAPVTATASTVQPNPLTRPPVPLSVMGTEQRITWQTLNAKQQAEQAALEKQMLDTDVARVNNDSRQEQMKQGRAMIAELSTLTPHDLENYPLQKAELFRKYPAAAGSLEVDRAIGPLDERYTKHLNIDADLRKAQTTRAETNQQKRVNEGYEEAKKLGPEVWARYSALVDKDPENAIKYVTDLAIPAQRENAIQKLKDAGFTEDQIAQRYLTGANFNYPAAAEAIKTRTAASQERARITQHWALLDKKRTDTKLLDPDAWDASGLEEEYKAATAEMLATTPKVGDNRGGVVGMGDLPMLPQGETYTAGRRAPVTPVVRPQATPAQQSVMAPARPAFSVGGGGAQQYGTRTAAPTGTAAAPAAPREKTRVNPQTGHIIVLRNGTWVDPDTGRPVGS